MLNKLTFFFNICIYIYTYLKSFIVNSLYKGPPADKINLIITNKTSTLNK